jgi:hypothetical protein
VTAAKHHLVVGGAYAGSTVFFLIFGAGVAVAYVAVLIVCSIWGALVH